jgi:hypothetical protein
LLTFDELFGRQLFVKIPPVISKTNAFHGEKAITSEDVFYAVLCLIPASFTTLILAFDDASGFAVVGANVD